MTRKYISVHGNLAFRRDGTLKIRQSAVDWNNPVGGKAGRRLRTSEVFVRRMVETAALGVDDALGEGWPPGGRPRLWSAPGKT
jgi:hypothetical protein